MKVNSGALKALGFMAWMALVYSVSSANAAVMTFQQSGVYDHLMRQIRMDTGSSTASSAVGNVSASFNPLRSVNAFDLSAIPAGSTITSVTFQAIVENVDTGFNKPVELHEVTNVNTIEIIPGGDSPNGATWSNVRTGISWGTPGGDLAATVASSVDPTVDGEIPDGIYAGNESFVFASSGAFVTAAQNAFDGGGPLQFLLKSSAQEAAETRAFVRWRGDVHSDPAQRPSLTVTYTAVPEPASCMIIGTVLLGLVSVRRSSRS